MTLVLNSAPATVLAVNSAPSGAAVRRQVADATTDSLVVTWNATSNDRTQQRIVITVDLGGSLGMQSLVADGGSNIDDDTRSWSLPVSDFQAADWNVVGTTQELNVTEADLRKALSVRVESQQATSLADAVDDEWNASNTESADADPAEGNGG